MATLDNYKGLQVFTPDSPSGAGGLAINNDFKSLVDWNPKSKWDATADPTADDDSSSTENYQVGSLWYRTDNGMLFMCIDATATAAVWQLVLVQPITDKPLQAEVAGDTRGDNATDWQRVRNSDNQVASGIESIIAGGAWNRADGEGSAVTGGRNNQAAGDYSSVPGGRNNRATSEYSTTLGRNSKTELEGQVALANGQFGLAGDAQASQLVARNETTNATGTELFLDGTTERLVLPNDKTWAFSGLLVARRTDAGTDSAGWEFKGVIENFGGTVAMVGSATVTSIGDDSGGTWAFTITADDTNNALKLAVTGEASKTIRWVAKIDLAEVEG